MQQLLVWFCILIFFKISFLPLTYFHWPWNLKILDSFTHICHTFILMKLKDKFNTQIIFNRKKGNINFKVKNQKMNFLLMMNHLCILMGTMVMIMFNFLFVEREAYFRWENKINKSYLWKIHIVLASPIWMKSLHLKCNLNQERKLLSSVRSKLEFKQNRCCWIAFLKDGGTLFPQCINTQIQWLSYKNARRTYSNW